MKGSGAGGRVSPGTLAHVLLLATVMVWGATFVVVKDALRDVSPLLFNLLRMGLAFAVLAAVHARGMGRITRRGWVGGGVAGVLLAAGYQLQTLGLARTTPIRSALLTGLVVVFVPLLSALPGLGGARLRWTALLGAGLAFGGIYLLTTPAGTTLGGRWGAVGVGDWLTLGCAIAFAGHLLALARYSPGLPTAQLATVQIGVAALVMLLTLPLGGRVHVVCTLRLAVALAVTSVLATALAFTAQSWAQRHLPATHTALILALEPVFAWLTALAFLGETLEGRSLAGAGLILGGIAVTESMGVKVEARSALVEEADHIEEEVGGGLQ